MKRQRKFVTSFAILALGLGSGYWVSTTYANPGIVGSGESSTWQLVRQVSKSGASSLMMPFFDYRKGP